MFYLLSYLERTAQYSALTCLAKPEGQSPEFRLQTIHLDGKKSLCHTFTYNFPSPDYLHVPAQPYLNKYTCHTDHMTYKEIKVIKLKE